jgi:hypothetical protein
VLKNMPGEYAPDLSVSERDPMAGCCERGNEPSDYVKGGEILE